MSDAGPWKEATAGLDGGTDSAAAQLAERELQAFRDDIERVEAEIGRAVVGQTAVVRQLIVVALAGGHALLEGVPGLGKTLLVRSVATALGLGFGRVQCTPDLMPADVTGTDILFEGEAGSREIRFRPGPIFSMVLLADEINRTTPKTQSAFLEAMEERQVTVAGRTHPLPDPFMVLATQNPIEMEGTFPLPEAQLDRFLFKIVIEYPGRDELVRIAGETTGPDRPDLAAVLSPERVLEMRALARRIPASAEIIEAAVGLVRATHPTDESAGADVRRFVRFGASPRAVQGMILGAKVQALLAGRCHVAEADLASTALPALRHRLLLNFEAGTAAVGADTLIHALAERHLQ